MAEFRRHVNARTYEFDTALEAEAFDKGVEAVYGSVQLRQQALTHAVATHGSIGVEAVVVDAARAYEAFLCGKDAAK